MIATIIIIALIVLVFWIIYYHKIYKHVSLVPNKIISDSFKQLDQKKHIEIVNKKKIKINKSYQEIRKEMIQKERNRILEIKLKNQREKIENQNEIDMMRQGYFKIPSHVKTLKDVKHGVISKPIDMSNNFTITNMKTIKNGSNNVEQISPPTAKIKNKGFVYILSNPNIPKKLKIGKTTRTVEERIKELSNHAGVPGQYIERFSRLCSDCDEGEIEVHKRLNDYRKDGEFFEVSIERAIECVTEVATLIDVENMKNG